MAANAVIGSLRVNLGMSSAELKNDVKTANRSLQRFQKKMAGVARVAAVSFAGLAAAATAAFSGMVSDADKMAKASKGIGLTTEELGRLKFAADLSGVGFDKLTGSMGKLSKTMADSLRTSTSEQAIAFKALGVSVLGVDGNMKSSVQVLKEVADKFAVTRDSTEKTAVAMALFGRSGKAMIPLLNEGAAGISKMGDEAERLGLVFDTQTSKKAEVFNDTMNRLGKVFEGFRNMIGIKLLPLLQKMADYFLNTASGAESLRAVADGTVKVFKFLASATVAVVRSFQALAVGIETVGKAVAAIGEGWGAVKVEVSKGVNQISKLVFGASAAIKTIWSDTSKKLETIKVVPPELPVINYTNALVGMGKSISKTQTKSTDFWKGLRKVSETAQKSLTPLASTLESAFGSWIDSAVDKTFKWKDALADLRKSLLKLSVNRAVMSLIGSVGFGGGAPVNLLPGFANGGSFNVGGAGGIDSQVVAFRASPNENVSITKPGQSGGMQPSRIQIGVSFDDDAGFRAYVKQESVTSAVQVVAAASSGIEDNAVAKSGRALADGGFSAGMAVHGASRQAKSR